MENGFRITLVGTALALCCAAALGQERGAPKVDAPLDKLRPVTKR